MTQTLPHVTDNETGKRFYPIDGENFWSCSTVTGILDKSGLTYWAGGLAAAFAFDELPTILSASMIAPCGRSYAKCKHESYMPHIAGECPCRVCEGCIRKKMANLHDMVKRRRADEGKQTHKVIDWWVKSGGQWIAFDPEVAPYVGAFKVFVAEYGIQPSDFLWTEAIVVNRTHKYAGTTDGILQIHADRTPAAAELVAKLLSKTTGTPITAEQAADQHLIVLVVIDFKTQDKAKEDEAFYPDQALQLVGYRKAETIRLSHTDEESPMPHTDGALLIHLRPDGCTPRLTVSDETTFEAFILALRLFEWVTTCGTASISTRSFPLPKPAKATKATPRKTAASAADKPPAKRAAPVKRAAAPAARPSSTLRSMAPLATVGSGHPRGAQLTDDDIPF